MILRYVVETNFRPVFTASKRVENETDAGNLIDRLKRIKLPDGISKKYSSFILYSDGNKIIKRF